MKKYTHSTFLTKRPYFFLVFFFLFIVFSTSAQTNLVAELSGNPVDTSDWTLIGANVQGEEIVLTQAASSQVGAVYYSEPYNLNQCIKWKIEFDFRMYDGNPHADGMAFWYLENPPENFVEGGAIGMPANGKGLKVVFDTYDNDNYDVIYHNPNPEIQVYYGTGYSEENNIIPHSNMLLQYWPGLQSSEYQHAEILWNDGLIEIYIDGVLALSGNVEAFDEADQIQEGYFGFSASTGLYYDRHSIKNVKVYNSGIELQQPEMDMFACDEFDLGYGHFDLTLIEGQMSEEGTFSYHFSENEAYYGLQPIGSPEDFYNFEAWEQTIYVRVENEEGCFSTGILHLHVLTGPEPVIEEVTLTACNLDGEGAHFDLTSTQSDFFGDNADELSFLYFHSEEDATEGNNAIEANPSDYISPENETIYVRVEETVEGCFTVVQIHLIHTQPPVLHELTDLETCGIDGFFYYDLTVNDPHLTDNRSPLDAGFSYHTNPDDAATGENAIENPSEYFTEVSDCVTIYIRLANENDYDCYTIGSFEVCGFDTYAGTAQDLSQCMLDPEIPGVFDLTLNHENILGEQNPEEYNVSYYTSEEDAQNGQNAIENAEAYSAQNHEQPIYFRIENNHMPSCYQTGSFVLYTMSTLFMNSEQSPEVCANTEINLTELIDMEYVEEIEGYYSSVENVLSGNKIENHESYRMNQESSVVYVLGYNSDYECAIVYEVHFRVEACEIFIPQGFSPNGDGVNDFFVISNLESYPAYSLKIYNRYGILLYNGNANTSFWDGTAKNGDQVPSATYYYILDLKNQEKPIRGWVYLNR